MGIRNRAIDFGPDAHKRLITPHGDSERGAISGGGALGYLS